MRRRVGFLFIIGAAIPVAVFASTAWACGALTTLHASASVVAPNQVISVTARNFAAGPAAGGTNSPVQIRWASRDGEVLEEVPEGGSRGDSITRNVRVPANAAPGWYVINATQFTATGAPKSGSPARTTVRVQGAAAPGATAPWGGGTPTSAGPGSPDLPLPGILLSVALLATGLTLVFRDRGRKATRPALGA